MAIGLDDIKRLSGGKKLLILLGALLLIGYFYWFYLLQPAVDRTVKLEDELETLKGQIVARQRVADQIERHKEEIAALEEDLALILAKLPERKDIPRLLTAVSEAGKDAGLEFILFEPLEPVSKEFYAEIPVKMIVTGGYHDIAVFFDSVSHLPRIATITEVIIKRGHGQPAGGETLQADCLMKIYMFVERADEKTDTQKG